MKQITNTEKPGSLRVHHLGLSIEVSERVLRAWAEVPEEERFRYLNQTYEAQKNARALERATKLRDYPEHHDDEQDEEPLFVCVPIAIKSRKEGPIPKWRWQPHRLGALWSAELNLIRAWRKGDGQFLRRMAERLLRGRAKAKGRAEPKGVQIKHALLEHWVTPASAGIPLEPDGICLIWFSTGAIEELLRKGGLWEIKKTVKALEARITRLRLPKLPEPIVHLKHLHWKEEHLIVS